MKLAPQKRQEITSATLAQTLWLIVGCSALLVISTHAAQPSWWSSPGTGPQSAVVSEQVVTNSGVITTNYIPNDYVAVAQGQLKQFTARAADTMNAKLFGGAGTNLNNLVAGWKQDYLTNGYSATNIKPSDYTAMTVGQLKYVGNMVWNRLVAVGYTNAVPSWLARNTNSDYAVANLGQLKSVFNFDLVGSPSTITDLSATANSDGSVTLSWSFSGGSSGNGNPIIIQGETADGSWVNLETVSASAGSAMLPSDTVNRYQNLNASNATGTGNSSSSAASSVINPNGPPPPQYAVIDLGTNTYPIKITDSGYVLSGGTVWHNGSTNQLQATVALDGDGSPPYWTASDIGEDGTVVGTQQVYHTDGVFGLGGFFPYVGNLAIWSTNSAGTYGSGDNKPSLTSSPIFLIDGATHTDGVAGYDSGSDEYGDSSFVNAMWAPFFISATTIYSTQITGYPTMVDGFAAPRASLTGGELGTIALTAPGSGSLYTGQAVFPVAANDSGQFVTENNSNYATIHYTYPWDNYFFQPQTISYSAGGPTGRLTLPAGLTPQSGLGKISNVNALGTFYLLGSDRTFKPMTNIFDFPFTPPTKYECWDGTNIITLPQLSTNTPPGIVPDGVNAMTTTLTIPGSGTNAPTSQVVPVTQVIGNGAYGYVWNMVPSTNSPPTFAAPKQLDALVPGYSSTNAPWSHITAASINDGGTIVGTATYSGTNYPTGQHGVMLLPVQFVRETPPGSGNFQPLPNNGLDDKAQLPIFHPDMATTQNNDETCSGGYIFTAQLSQNLNNTSTASMTILFYNATGTFSGTVTETSAGSGIFTNADNTFTVTLSPATQTTSNSVLATLNVQVTDSALGLNNAPFVLDETGLATLKFTADIILAEVDLSGTLSATAVNTIMVSLSGSQDGHSVSKSLTETGVNTRIFTDSQGDMTVTINSLSGNVMQISVQNNFLQVHNVTLTLTETTSTSNVFSNITVTPTTFTALDPGSSGEGIFYIQVKGFNSTVPIIVSSGANSVTVNAAPVSGAPGMIRTPPIALLAPGTSGSYSGITTLRTDPAANTICFSIFGTKIDPPRTNGGAFIGRAINSWQMPFDNDPSESDAAKILGFLDGANGDQHLNKIEKILIGSASANIKGLGWSVTKDQTVTYSEITSDVSKFSLFYIFAHGATPSGSTSTLFGGFSVWPNYLDISTHPLVGTTVTPSTISANISHANYTLVFINGCASADDSSSDGVPMAFAAAFKNASAQSDPSQTVDTAYVGWDTEVGMPEAGSAGPEFFTALESTIPGMIPTIQSAVNAVNSQATQNGYSIGTLQCLTGSTNTVDLNPIPPTQ